MADNNQADNTLTGLGIFTAIANAQAQRNIVDNSIASYLGYMRTVTRILCQYEELRLATLEHEQGFPLQHTGEAKGIFRIKFPMKPEHVSILFAMISVDPTLAKKGRKRKRSVEEMMTAPAEITTLLRGADLTKNVSKDVATCSAQTYQNYKSAFKWWYEYSMESWGKVAHKWNPEFEFSLTKQVAAYKRDVAEKKRGGIMKQKEGKSGYSLSGYIELNHVFERIKPTGKKRTWDEGIFASIFTVLSVNTIGRSDNIDDLLLQNIGWNNDAMTVLFNSTKSDQCGDTTSNTKRLYANPFKPEVCPVLKLAVFIFCVRRTKARNSTKLTTRLFEGANQNSRYYDYNHPNHCYHHYIHPNHCYHCYF